jgi:hypothetical protein
VVLHELTLFLLLLARYLLMSLTIQVHNPHTGLQK